jgi:hypothetical protein
MYIIALDYDHPTCCDYGKNRRIQYPGYFFCTPCLNWDNTSWDRSSRNQRNSTRNACRANHTSWIGPTDRRLISSHSSYGNTSILNVKQQTNATKRSLSGESVYLWKKKKSKFGNEPVEIDSINENVATVGTNTGSVEESRTISEEKEYEIELEELKKN